MSGWAREKKKGVGSHSFVRRRKGSGVILLGHEEKEKGRGDGSGGVRRRDVVWEWKYE
jgi:hypothetical protein